MVVTNFGTIGFGDQVLQLVSRHDPRLSALAVMICGIGCFSAINLITQARVSPEKQAVIWLPAAALAFGLSVWSMHFLAMLAFNMDMPVSYDPAATVDSVALASFGALLAFTAWYAAPSRLVGVIAGGTLLGLAVGAMHYTGVAAMRMPGAMRLDPLQVGISLFIGIALCCVAFSRFATRAGLWRRLEVTAWLVLAICGLHFTGMLALRVTPGAGAADHAAMLGTASLAAAVGSVSLAIVILFLGATLMQRHLAERAAQEDHRLRLMNDLAREALVIHRHGRILEVNHAASKLLGKTEDALTGQAVLSLFAAEDAPGMESRLQQTGKDIWPEEMQVLAAQGDPVSVEVASQTIPFHGKSASMVILRDLTDRKRNEARMRYLSHHDTLTDLPSRHFMQELLQSILRNAASRGTGCGVLYLDLDRFKSVNDLLGHAGGDAVLVEVARRLRAQTRGTDSVARLGGDEFVVVLAEVRSPEEISAFASRVIRSLEEPFHVGGRQVIIGVSIGAAMYPRDGADQENLLRAADKAMYRAKTAGGGCMEFFEPRMDGTLSERRLLEQELQGALQRDELVLYYQPLVNCQTGRIDGFEALLRWKHPRRGLLSAGEFIPLAEATGIITRIDNWVIEHACIAATSWPASQMVAVNVSSSRFRHADLADLIASALAKSGLEPARLELEITESVLIEDAGRAVKTLSQLRDFGVSLSLDDFGTGYSSLNYLRLFRFDKFKVDRSFVNDLGQSQDAATIIGAIINLGHSLNLAVTVEGVETDAQLTKVMALGADQVQGYLLGRPAPRENFSRSDMQTSIHATAASRPKLREAVTSPSF